MAGGGLDERTAALARVAAAIATGAPQEMYDRLVAEARSRAASAEDIVDVLAAVGPAVGTARVVSAAPRIARAIGYDIDAAFEAIDPEQDARGLNMRIVY